MGLRRRRRSSASLSDGSFDMDKNGLLSPVKVHYARKKKPESRLSIAIQIMAIVACAVLAYYVYYHFDHFHFNVVHFYATKLDDPNAQHNLGHKLLKSGENPSAAFHWFRQSAAKGHPHSAYNLAVGHLSGYQTDLRKGNYYQSIAIYTKRQPISITSLSR